MTTVVKQWLTNLAPIIVVVVGGFVIVYRALTPAIVEVEPDRAKALLIETERPTSIKVRAVGAEAVTVETQEPMSITYQPEQPREPGPGVPWWGWPASALGLLLLGWLGGKAKWNTTLAKVRGVLTFVVGLSTLFFNGYFPHTGWAAGLMWSHIAVGYLHLYPFDEMFPRPAAPPPPAGGATP